MIPILLVIIWLMPSFLFGQETLKLESIVIRNDADSHSFSLPNKTYPAKTFTEEYIEQKNPNTLVDILDYSSGLEVRSRGQFGIQGDLSLRGSGFEQVAVAIDGVNIMDPQTGHHNLDIPLTVYDIERIQVLKEGASTIYGQGSLAGSVDFIIKKPDKSEFHLDNIFGEHGLFGQTFSFSLPQKDLSSRVSFEHVRSKAARSNTDFEYRTATLYLNREREGLTLDTLFGFQKKDFGADSFYSNLFPEEEEHTETLFFRSGVHIKGERLSTKDNLYFRKHRDKFILRRHSPTSVNYHTTYVYGLDTDFKLATGKGDLVFGVSPARDEIYSSNLGKHTRLRENNFIGFMPDLGEKLELDARVGLDFNQGFGWQESYNLGASYKVSSRIKLRGSTSRSYRNPSFTELFYSDAANKGDSALLQEVSDNFNAGFVSDFEWIEFGADAFLRKGKNLIDWVRSSNLEAWRATNLGSVDFSGIEFNSKICPALKSKNFNLEKVLFSYAYMQADKKPTGFLSKYALDILKHRFILDIYYGFLGLKFDFQLSYNRRYYGETYFVGNLCLSKMINCRSFSFEPFVKIDNFSDSEYSEISGVLQPGRWIKAGLKFEW